MAWLSERKVTTEGRRGGREERMRGVGKRKGGKGGKIELWWDGREVGEWRRKERRVWREKNEEGITCRREETWRKSHGR